MTVYDYSYVIQAIETDINAQSGPYIRVVFSSTGRPDIPFQFWPPNYTDAELETYIQNTLAPQAVNAWAAYQQRIDDEAQAAIDLANSQLTQNNVGVARAGSFDKPDPIITASDIPLAVSMRQARLALKQEGLLATVQSNIDALPEESQIEWEYAAQVERSSPLVASLGAALGLTETQLDDLFKLAITL